MTGNNSGAPLGSAICTRLVDSDSVVTNIAVGVGGAIAGALAWDNAMATWSEREKKRQEQEKLGLSSI
jgi:hypothetical protein